MVVAGSTRRRARERGDGDGVHVAPVVGGPGAELGDQLSVVMKFGGSSVSSAARMEEVAGLILAFPEERPVVVLSAMGKTTNLLLLAGEKAVGCGVIHVSDIEEWNTIKDLHIKTVDELGLQRSVVHDTLDELEQLLKGIAMMKELTLRTRDYLVSFGECMSTRIFAAYLNKIGVKARQTTLVTRISWKQLILQLLRDFMETGYGIQQYLLLLGSLGRAGNQELLLL